MRLFFIRLLSECSRSEDHARDRQAGLTKFRELHKDSLPLVGKIMMTIIIINGTLPLCQVSANVKSRVRGNLHARFSGGGKQLSCYPDSRRSVTIAFN